MSAVWICPSQSTTESLTIQVWGEREIHSTAVAAKLTVYIPAPWVEAIWGTLLHISISLPIKVSINKHTAHPLLWSTNKIWYFKVPFSPLYESKSGPALALKELKRSDWQRCAYQPTTDGSPYKHHYRLTHRTCWNSVEGATTPLYRLLWESVSSDVKQRRITGWSPF